MNGDTFFDLAGSSLRDKYLWAFFIISCFTTLVHRFINSVTNFFTQDLVLSEQERHHNLGEYVSIIANRST